MPFLVLYVTYPDEASAKTVSNQLLDKRLIACVNIFPITSMYTWDGAVQNDHEWVSIVKTTLACGQLVENEILSVHPYKIPCIMRMEISANQAYEDWITGCVAAT
jgi:periplasmic divalent cation tolerance protein